MHIAISHCNHATASTPIAPAPSNISYATRIVPGGAFSVPVVVRAKLVPVNRATDLAAEAERLFVANLISVIPRLRAFGFFLSHDKDKADDLVQETLFKALRHQNQFTPDSNMAGWLMTILRNEFYTMIRKRREVEDVDDMFSSRLSVAENQLHALDLREAIAAIQLLPDGQRSAVLLVAAFGYTCQEAADRCQTKVGTIKSRLNRGRATLKRKFSHGSSPQ